MRLIIRMGNAAGVIDETGKLVVQPKFTGLLPFSEGLAAYNSGSRWGYVDPTGQVVIPAAFEEAGSFSCGVAFVKLAGLYGLIDQKGEWLCRPMFASAAEFREGLGLVQRAFTSPFGYLTTTGEYAIEPRFHPLAQSFSEGLALVAESSERCVSFGYIDPKGNFKIEAQYARAWDFSEGLAAISRKSSGRNVGFIDRDQKVAIDARFDGAIMKFSEGLCHVCGSGGYGFIDKYGELIIDCKFYVTGFAFSEGLCDAGFKAEKKMLQNGYINTSGEWVIEPQFLAAKPFKNGIAHVSPDAERWGYINKKGEYIWEPTA